MKKQIKQNRQFTPPHSLLLILICMVAFSRFSSAQNFSQAYQNPTPFKVQTPGNTIHVKYHASSNYNFDGTVTFSNITDNNIHFLQITLTDNLGNVIKNTVYEDALNVTTFQLAPVSATYNANLDMYILTGVDRSIACCNNRSSWYILLDNNLDIIATKQIAITSANLGTGQTTFITDVCPVYDDPGTDFAFTGVILDVSNAPTFATDADLMNPTIEPIVYTNILSMQPYNRSLFIAKLDANAVNVIDVHEFQLNIGLLPSSRYTFPNKIIEIPNGTAMPGYLVGGMTFGNNTNEANSSFLYRTNQNFTISDGDIKEPVPTSDVTKEAIGNMYYDKISNEVNIAGSIKGTGNSNYFFFDKMMNLATSTSIDLFSEIFASNEKPCYRLNTNALGLFQKINSISESFNNESIVMGSFDEVATLLPAPYGTTSHVPFITKVDFSTNNLLSWSSLPMPNLELYPRLYNNVTNSNFYKGLDYSNTWFSNHQSFEFDYNNREFMLGSNSTDFNNSTDNYTVLNKTDNEIDNNCQHITLQADRVDISHDNFPPIFNSFTPTWNEVNIPVVDNGLTGLQSYDCVSQIPFKPIVLIENINIYSSTNSLKISNLKGTERISIYNMNGQLIFTQNATNTVENINTTSFASGLYLVKFISDNQMISSHKFIK